MKIAIDLMGADTSPEELLKACMETAAGLPADVDFIFISTSVPKLHTGKKERFSFGWLAWRFWQSVHWLFLSILLKA